MNKLGWKIELTPKVGMEGRSMWETVHTNDVDAVLNITTPLARCGDILRWTHIRNGRISV